MLKSCLVGVYSSSMEWRGVGLDGTNQEAWWTHLLFQSGAEANSVGRMGEQRDVQEGLFYGTLLYIYTEPTGLFREHLFRIEHRLNNLL